jgi:hypothetical protein
MPTAIETRCALSLGAIQNLNQDQKSKAPAATRAADELSDGLRPLVMWIAMT